MQPMFFFYHYSSTPCLNSFLHNFTMYDALVFDSCKDEIWSRTYYHWWGADRSFCRLPLHHFPLKSTMDLEGPIFILSSCRHRYHVHEAQCWCFSKAEMQDSAKVHIHGRKCNPPISCIAVHSRSCNTRPICAYILTPDFHFYDDPLRRKSHFLRSTSWFLTTRGSPSIIAESILFCVYGTSSLYHTQNLYVHNLTEKRSSRFWFQI